MRITELTPARLLARSSAASPAATSDVRTSDCAWFRTVFDCAIASSHAWGVTGIGPGEGALRMAALTESRWAFAGEVRKLTRVWDCGRASR